MKDNKHIKSFNEHQENLNISDVSVRLKTHRVNDVINGRVVFVGDFDECLYRKHKNGYGYRISELKGDEIRIANEH
jgi:hypothetical protein